MGHLTLFNDTWLAWWSSDSVVIKIYNMIDLNIELIDNNKLH